MSGGWRRDNCYKKQVAVYTSHLLAATARSPDILRRAAIKSPGLEKYANFSSSSFPPDPPHENVLIMRPSQPDQQLGRAEEAEVWKYQTQTKLQILKLQLLTSRLVGLLNVKRIFKPFSSKCTSFAFLIIKFYY